MNTLGKMSLRNLLFSYSFGLIFLILLLVLILFNSLFQMVDEMQDRVQQYINLSQFSSDLDEAKENYINLFTAIQNSDEEEAARLKDQAVVMQARNSESVKSFVEDYENSPDKYFYSRALINGIEYLGIHQLEIMDSTVPISQETFSKYYWIIEVYDYLLDYSTNMYLKVAVSNDVEVLADNIERGNSLRRLTVTAFACLLAVCIVLIVFFTKKMMNPVNKVAQVAEEISKGNLDTPDIDLSAPKELISLQHSMNSMKASLKNSITLERKLHTKEVEHLRMTRELDRARYMSLQAQINPHFLFNALNIISHTALFEQADQTVKLTNTLAGFMRYTLEFKDDVELGRELDFVRQYLVIQKARFGERLSYSINCPEILEGFLIPPLLIQPFVENALKHGIEPCENGGSVDISVRTGKTRITIAILDTGVGISGDPLNTPSKSGRVGIQNVNERLKLYFGSRAKLTISRVSESGGTSVQIEIPVRKQKAAL